MRIRLDAVRRRDAVADRDDSAPLAEDSPEHAIFGEALPETVEPLGDNLVRSKGERLRSDVGFDAREDSLIAKDLHKRSSVRRLLPDRLVVKDHATYELCDPRRTKEQLAIRPPISFDVLDADRVEPFLDRTRALVRGEDAFAGCDECARGLG